MKPALVRNRIRISVRLPWVIRVHLPVLNKEAVRLAVKMGLACHSEIETWNYFARKNYFYPDLPKGYQISQHTTPICKGGYVNIGHGPMEKKKYS